MNKQDHLNLAVAYLERAEQYLLRANEQANDETASLYRQMASNWRKLAVTEENLAGLRTAAELN